MFASLKNKIKEETGNDPTARIIVGISSGKLSTVNNHEANRAVSIQESSNPRSRDSPLNTHTTPSSISSIEDLEDAKISLESSKLGRNDGVAKNFVSGCERDNRSSSDVPKETFEDSTVLQNSNYSTLVQTESNDINEEPRALTDEFERKVCQYLKVKDIDQNGLRRFLLSELEKLKFSPDLDNKLQIIKLQLIEAQHQGKEANKMCLLLTQDLASERKVNAELKEEVIRLQEEVNKQTKKVKELGTSLERELEEKDVILLRNAQLNQDIEMSKQESRSQEQDTSELQSRLCALEATIVEREKDMARQARDNEALHRKLGELESAEFASVNEQEFKKTIASLEEQLAEKVKSIRVLQQHLNDLKKTLQRELKQNGEETSENNPATLLTAMPTKHAANSDNDVNFSYLKHVIMKFLTSREYEAQHLTRAVSTLLRFTPEEERLLRDTLDWKMSWFGTRPRLGFGQTSKTIPPS